MCSIHDIILKIYVYNIHIYSTYVFHLRILNVVAEQENQHPIDGIGNIIQKFPIGRKERDANRLVNFTHPKITLPETNSKSP